MIHTLLDWMGLTDASGKPYLFWSGIGADLSEFAVVGGVFAAYRKHNCHVHRCWRLARHPVADTQWIVCRRHHPEDAPTHEEVLAAGCSTNNSGSSLVLDGAEQPPRPPT